MTVDKRRTTARRTRWGTAAAMAAAALIVVGGCSSQGSGDAAGAGGGEGDAVETGLINVDSDPGEPVDGGTLTYGAFAPVATLDPTATKPDGATGGTELAAVYGLLARYDYGSESFVPQLAESISPSDNATTWTITLREGVTFSDSTPLDADAVVASIERYNEKGGANAQLYMNRVERTVATGPTTVTVTLKKPWPQFPSLLASGEGMIVAPSAYEDGGFEPIGAGPYAVANLVPQRKLVLTARDDYWNGRPHLDEVRFIALSDDDARQDSLRNGDADAAYIFHPEDASEEISASSPGFVRTDALGAVGQINTRDGHPGADPRVRKAIAYGVDPSGIDQRVNNGEGLPGTDMFADWSRWHSDVGGVAPDPDKAKKLLQQAEADGYDGHLVYVGTSGASGKQRAVAVQAALEAIGFDVQVDYVNDATDLVRRLYADHDFDLAFSAYNVSDAAPGVRLFGALYSTSATNVSGYDDPEMDGLLDDVFAASDDAAKRDAIVHIQKLVDADEPFAVWGANRSFVAWNGDVHGIVPSDYGIMLLGDAWKN